MAGIKSLVSEISRCTVCSQNLSLEPRPVLSAHSQSKLVIIGQAPGLAVHQSGIPWDDRSGQNLRSWLQIDKQDFYNPRKVALVPMGFCYPGKGRSGDLPPRKECAPLWHPLLMQKLNKVELILLVGKYAQKYYLGKACERSLSETVYNFSKFLPKYFVLPHPSPRNNIWQAKNPWFAKEVLPILQERIKEIFA
ncbi:MAG: uracil-DNA glycosylase family protein [Spirochaetota bacterium]